MWLALVTLAVLLLAGIWLYGRRAAWLADQWQRELTTASDEQLVPRLRQAADLGEPGVTVLADALCSSRGPLSEAAAEVLDEELHRWMPLPPADTLGRRIALAETLAQRVEAAEPEGRSRAADVAERLVRWAADPRAPAGRVILACERVLEARDHERASPAVPAQPALDGTDEQHR
jgi:hypothetical protein